jgi:hypothetical protein
MKLTHPESAVTVETSADKSEAYTSQGWVEAKATKPADEKPANK